MFGLLELTIRKQLGLIESEPIFCRDCSRKGQKIEMIYVKGLTYRCPCCNATSDVIEIGNSSYEGK